jgi:bis(5'-nucleosidyl)-tetraphosphatase
MKSEKYRKSVFVVTYAKTRKGIEYLLLKRKLHWIGWEFPKGGRRIYETKKGTVKREIKEETGLKIIKGKIKKFDIEGKFKYEKKYPDRKSFVGQSYSLYSAEVKKPLNGEIRIDKREHSDYKWVSFKEAIKNLRWPNQKNCLKIVNSKIKLD